MELCRMLGQNFRNFFYDWALILTTIVSLLTSILTFWRLRSHRHWYSVTLFNSVKENLKLKQEIILELIIARIKLNIVDFFTDVATLLALSFNIFGFWRYSTLHRRYKLKILTRKDMITNPFYSLCDLPWLIMCIVVLFLGPWRFICTFMKLS
jgi:hypothetical protein